MLVVVMLVVMVLMVMMVMIVVVIVVAMMVVVIVIDEACSRTHKNTYRTRHDKTDEINSHLQLPLLKRKANKAINLHCLICITLLRFVIILPRRSAIGSNSYSLSLSLCLSLSLSLSLSPSLILSLSLSNSTSTDDFSIYLHSISTWHPSLYVNMSVYLSTCVFLFTKNICVQFIHFYNSTYKNA